MSHLFTYKSRVRVAPHVDAALGAWAELHGRAERRLASLVLDGTKVTVSDPGYKALRSELNISDRNANAALVGADAKVKAAHVARERQIADLDGRIERAEAVLDSGTVRRRPMTPSDKHQKKRRLATLRARRDAVASGERPKLCFGSRRLFRAQFDLAANGYASHDDWRADWCRARSSEILVTGRASELRGNSTCQATFNGGRFSLRLRLPYALEAEHGKTITLRDIDFRHGNAAVCAAIARPDNPKTKSQQANSPVTYRFVRPDDGNGWLVYVTVHVEQPALATSRQRGAVGVDFNADHIALAELDACGNPIDGWREHLNLRGLTTNQRRETIRVIAKSLAERARDLGKPVVVEKLDFAEKKRALEAVDRRQAHMLSALAFAQFGAAIRAACFRAGVDVIEVNPAWTSVIGAVNYASKLGISIHIAAAIAIARRGLRLSEKAAGTVVRTPSRGDHVTFALPERNRAKHVWSHWAAISRSRRAAIESHLSSCGRRKSAARTRAGPDASLAADAAFLRQIPAATPDVKRVGQR